MNIGPLLRSMMGDVRSGEPKSLELKTGQVVRGTVLSVSEDGQEAVIQVQGVKLHAALETPLRPGETTLLQVQPDSKDGLAVLKPVQSAPGAVLSAASLAKALESLGLENTATNRDLLQLMQKSGIPLTKDNLSLLQQVNGQKPAGVPLSEWIQAVGIALGRGLPLTGESVAGLHQAVFGPPLHVLLSSLEEQMAGFLRQAGQEATTASSGQTTSTFPLAGTASQASGANPPTAEGAAVQAGATPLGGGAQSNQAAGLVQLARQGAFADAVSGPQTVQPGLQGQAAGGTGGALVAKLQAVLAELQASMLQEGMDGGSVPGRGSSGPVGGAPVAASVTGGAGAAAGGPASAAIPPQGEGPAGPSPAGTHPTPAAEPWVGRVLKLLGAEHEQQALRATAPAGTPAAGAAQEAPPAAGASARAAAGGAEAPGGQAAGSGPAAAPEAAPTPLRQVAAAGGATPGEGLTPPGKDPAAPAEARAGQSPVQPSGIADEAVAVAARNNGGSVGTSATGTAAHETLKGLLLQVMASDDLPAPLQEAARQLVQQLTGQQLLLNTDRTAPFAQVTMFLPFVGPDGRQTAAVHIESRRGRKGELDPDNCRLWFDLQMKALGQIMVDVQVADKKVLLKIYSEKEATGAFLESRQAEVSLALEGAGYRLLSLKAEPLIQPTSAEGVEADFSLPMSYAPSVYKGVDYRV
ncbi:flagellar hook-length control protein FliK [Paenibacillus sp. FSL R7-0216]|uniref:flagellar hook-length control protein FliK n=1 Tax=Paenibacillus sp. FSL R7-0216 TaxID=2921677 RepID=UPI0030DA6CB8